MAKRNSQLTELLIVAQDDYLTIVDTSAGQSKRVSVKNLTGLPDVGWTATGESWSFSSWNSTTRIGVVTVPTDATTKYSVGMWIRIAQTTGGTKYGMINAVTATTLTINFFSIYTLNNEAITSPVYSPLAQPYGAPGLPLESTDANGWRVYDYGITKRATYRQTWTGSMSIGATANLNLSSVPLPVGPTDRSALRWTYSYSTNIRVFLINETGFPATTNFNFVVNNWYTTSFTLTNAYIDIEVIDY